MENTHFFHFPVDDIIHVDDVINVIYLMNLSNTDCKYKITNFIIFAKSYVLIIT